MKRFSFWRATRTLIVFLFSVVLFSEAKHKPLPAVRWTENAPGCTFERGDDGRYRWTIAGKDLTVTLLVDSQELTKSRRRFYHLLGMYVSAKYTGSEKFEFPADVRIDFLRHHDVTEGYEDPTELSNKLQNAVDTLIFETERQIKKNPKIADEQTAKLREYQKDAAEFIEFLGTQTLRPTPAMLTPGNPEDVGWVFFDTGNKWIGPLKEHEDFIVSFWMKDKIWQFPVSLPPTPGDLILRKPEE
jgi:hypothetical protein